MSNMKTICVPDIGDFESVEVIEVAVSSGDSIEKEDTMLTLESDKATMDIPSPDSGIVSELKIAVGDQVKQGDVILMLECSLESDSNQESDSSLAPVETSKALPEATTASPEQASPTPSSSHEPADIMTEVLVLGAGPGGYTAAFRAADLDKKTVLVERYPTLGGVCLNVGCIPSKALLHVSKVINEIEELKEIGIDLGGKQADPKPIRAWTESVIGKLTGGLKHMAKQRKVTTVEGYGEFISPNQLKVSHEGQSQVIQFEQAIIAAGSEPVWLDSWPKDPRIFDSTGALLLKEIPQRLLVIGGGIIGLEMATVYSAMGSDVTVVEMMDSLMNSADKDLVRVYQKHFKKHVNNIYLKTAVTNITANDTELGVSFDGDKAPETESFDAILVAIGRKPNGSKLSLDKAGVNVDERGFITVDKQQRTNVNHIFAIGDIVGQPMLAHKATHEGKVAAEAIAGMKSYFDAMVIPSVAYTDPEVAWVGVTEEQAKSDGVDYDKGVFPWAASGRALSLGREEGLTKLLFDKSTKRVIGAGIIGSNAGDLIAEAALAIEMGCDAEDIGLTIHPHPTLSETVGMAAEAFEGTITDLYIPKK